MSKYQKLSRVNVKSKAKGVRLHLHAVKIVKEKDDIRRS